MVNALANDIILNDFNVFLQEKYESPYPTAMG